MRGFSPSNLTEVSISIRSFLRCLWRGFSFLAMPHVRGFSYLRLMSTHT